MRLPQKSQKHSNELYNKFEHIVVYRESGYYIDKSAEYNTLTGNRIPGTTVYTVYTDEGGLVDGRKTLKEAKQLLREWIA